MQGAATPEKRNKIEQPLSRVAADTRVADVLSDAFSERESLEIRIFDRYSIRDRHNRYLQQRQNPIVVAFRYTVNEYLNMRFVFICAQ